MPTYQARPFGVGTIDLGGLQYYDLAIGEPGYDYTANPPAAIPWYMGPDELPGFVIAKSNGAQPTFWRSTNKTDASYLALLQSIYRSMTGLTPGGTIDWFNSFLTTNEMYTTYEVSGSMNFAGSQDCYATVSGANIYFPGTGDFTAEWFQKQDVGASFPRIWQFGAWPSEYGTSVETGELYFWYNEQYIHRTLPTWNNVWIHIAISRRNGYLRLYHNGTQLGATEYIPDNITSAETVMHIGLDPGYASTTYYKGLLSNLHFIAGVGKYVEDFTSPTSGFNISYNSLLLMRAASSGTLLLDSSPVGLTVNNAGSTPITWSSDKPFV